MALASSAAAFVPAAIVASAGAGLASPGLVGVVARSVAGAARRPGAGRRQLRHRARARGGGALALVLLPQWRAGFVIGAVFTAVAGVAVLVLDWCPIDAAGAPSRPVGSVWGGASLADLRAPAAGALLLGAASAAVWTYGRAQLLEQGAGGTWSTSAGWRSEWAARPPS